MKEGLLMMSGNSLMKPPKVDIAPKRKEKLCQTNVRCSLSCSRVSSLILPRPGLIKRGGDSSVRVLGLRLWATGSARKSEHLWSTFHFPSPSSPIIDKFSSSETYSHSQITTKSTERILFYFQEHQDDDGRENQGY